MSWRENFARLRALAFGIGVALVLLELAMRLLTFFPWSTADFVADEATGFRQRPGITIAGNTLNSRGFNDVEWPVRQTSKRIGVVGDSFVFAAVPRVNNFVDRLGRLARPTEVLNLGILAAGPENYLGVLQKDGVELGLDAVVVVFFVGNDISQADQDYKTRIFFGSPRALLRSQRQLRFDADHLYTFKMLRGGWRLLHETLIGPPAPGEGTFSPEIFLALERDRLEYCRRQGSAAVERGYQGAAEFFGQLRRFGQERGIPVAVVLAPDQYQLDLELQAALLPPGAAADFDLELPQRRLGAALAASGLPYLDLLPELRQRAGGRQLYLDRDTHWNKAGNREVSVLLHQKLRAWGWLDS